MNFPDSLKAALEVATVFVFVAGGILMLLGIFDKTKRDRDRDTDDADQRLVALLKGEVDAQRRQLDSFGLELKELKEHNIKLSSENTTLKEVLQGRDAEAIRFQQEGFKAIKRGEETLALATANQESMQNLMTLLEKHLKIVEAVVKTDRGGRRKTPLSGTKAKVRSI